MEKQATMVSQGELFSSVVQVSPPHKLSYNHLCIDVRIAHQEGISIRGNDGESAGSQPDLGVVGDRRLNAVGDVDTREVDHVSRRVLEFKELEIRGCKSGTFLLGSGCCWGVMYL